MSCDFIKFHFCHQHQYVKIETRIWLSSADCWLCVTIHRRFTAIMHYVLIGARQLRTGAFFGAEFYCPLLMATSAFSLGRWQSSQ